MKCSIVMPVLNGETYIASAIKSVIAQDYTEWELIIVDGGSKDSTLKIVEEHRIQEPRIRLIHQTESGMYSAIFQGFDAANGTVFSWLNADDLYPSWALSVATNFLKASNNRKWITGFPGAWDHNGTLRYLLPIGVWPQKWLQKGYFHPNFLGCVQAESTFFLREIWQSLSSEDREKIRSMRLAGDYLIWRKFAQHTALLSVPTLMGGFRNHGDNRSIAQVDIYMDEVYATGTLKLQPRIGRRLGQGFSIIASVFGYRAALRASAKLNSDNQKM
ncbi:MAG: glycosyltransferase [Litorimonas sp.]